MAEVGAHGQERPLVRRPRMIGLNDAGDRVGEWHPKARISDALVRKLRELHEQHGLGWRRLAAQFELPPYTVKKILDYTRRNVPPTMWKSLD